MVNYSLSQFRSSKSKKNKKIKSLKDGVFGILTTSVVVSFLVGIMASNLFYDQIENSLAQLVVNSPQNYCSAPLTQEESVVQIVESTSPAVVSIIITKDVPVYVQDNSWGFFPSYSQDGTEKQEIGGGTGFIISEDGVVLTNKHVVLDEDAYYTVLTLDGLEYSAKVLAKDPIQDIAFLQIEQEGEIVTFSKVKLGDSDNIKVGQTVIAIGNALGEYQNTVSVGIVSGLGRTIEASGGSFYETLKGVIQSDTAINKGNSGGPLLNLKGEVIGINTAIDIGGQNIAFAVPINKAKKDVQQMKNAGEIIYPFLGVRYVGIDVFVQEQEGLSVDYGALVIRGQNGEIAIVPDSAADKAGIIEGDIILELGGQKITTDNNLGEEIIKHSPGEEVALKILRNTEEININIILGERDV